MPEALRLFKFFNPFKGFGKFICWSNPPPPLPPHLENPGSASEKLRSNGHVCRLISVGMTPGFAIISTQYSYYNRNGCFQKYPNDKKMNQHHEIVFRNFAVFNGTTYTKKVITLFLGCSVFQKLPDFTVLCTAHVHKKYNTKRTLRKLGLDFSTAG